MSLITFYTETVAELASFRFSCYTFPRQLLSVNNSQEGPWLLTHLDRNQVTI